MSGYLPGESSDLFDPASRKWVGLRDLRGNEQRVLSVIVAVGASRALTLEDDNCYLDCTASDLTLTVPAGLPAGFGCIVQPKGTVSIASAGGALLNGATTPVTRATASNWMFAIQARSVADSYAVTGV